MRKNLYIDTNVYLTFYHFSNEDLKELKKLIALINTENIRLFLPEQTKNEFFRNREVKISDALSKLKGGNLGNQFPMISHSYEEFKAMKKAIKQYEKNKVELLKKLQHDAENESLLADDILLQLFSVATYIDTTEEILNNAVTRYNVGNPPGKDKSYGDAINWESLLLSTPNDEDIYLISDDKDFYSKLNEKKFNSFLLKEWNEKKESDLYFFKRLSTFFREHYPDIEITSETEKEIIIKNLIDANSFDNAKSVVRKLRNFDNFSVQQLNDITSAFSSNNQIHWIGDDWTIRGACKEIIESNEEKINSEIFKQYDIRFNQ